MTWWQTILAIAVSCWMWHGIQGRALGIFSAVHRLAPQTVAVMAANLAAPVLVASTWILGALVLAGHEERWQLPLAGLAFLVLYWIVYGILHRVHYGWFPSLYRVRLDWGVLERMSEMTWVQERLMGALPPAVAGAVVLLAMRAWA